MTCLASTIGDDGTFLGADSQWTYDETLMNSYGGKICGIPGQGLLVAYDSSIRGGQILNRAIRGLKARKPPWTLDMVIDLAEFIMKVMENHGSKSMPNESGDLPDSPTEMLIATPGHIFGIYKDYSVYEDPKYTALGSGRDFALGAFHSMEGIKMSAEKKVRAAVEAACRFDPFVSPPIEIQRVYYAPKKRNKKP